MSDPCPLTRALGRTFRRASPPDLVRYLVRAWTRRFRAWARYWLHHAPLCHDLTVTTLPHYVRALATASVDVRLDPRYVHVLALPWARIPLRTCTATECRLLFHVVVGEPASVKQVPRRHRPVRPRCPFHLRVDRRTYRAQYARFRYNHLVEGYLQRDVLVATFVDVARTLVTTPFLRNVPWSIHVRDTFRRAVHAAVETMDVPTLHPLRRALRRVGDRVAADTDTDTSTSSSQQRPPTPISNGTVPSSATTRSVLPSSTIPAPVPVPVP